MEIQANCKCGKTHLFTSQMIVKEGALLELPNLLKQFDAKKVFLVADSHTYAAAGKAVAEIVEKESVKIVKCIFEEEALEPDEHSVGSAMMYYEAGCDVVIGVGSGVINHIKIKNTVENDTEKIGRAMLFGSSPVFSFIKEVQYE